MSEIKIITGELLKEWSACSDGLQRFCELFPDGADLQTAIDGLVEDGHNSWGEWLFDRCRERKLFPEIIQKGYRNSGNRNSGYGNSGDGNSGFFNTVRPTQVLFDKDSGLAFESETIQKLIRIINNIKPILVWIPEEKMNDEEKEKNPSHKTTGGYLKNRGYKYAWQRGWLKFTQEEKDFIKSLPNFSVEIFESITGINSNNQI